LINNCVTRAYVCKIDNLCRRTNNLCPKPFQSKTNRSLLKLNELRIISWRKEGEVIKISENNDQCLKWLWMNAVSPDYLITWWVSDKCKYQLFIKMVSILFKMVDYTMLDVMNSPNICCKMIMISKLLLGQQHRK